MLLCGECHEDNGFCELVSLRNRGPCERCKRVLACVECPHRHIKSEPGPSAEVQCGEESE